MVMGISRLEKKKVRLQAGIAAVTLSALIILAPQGQTQAIVAEPPTSDPAGKTAAGADGLAFELSRVPCSPRAPVLGDTARAQYAIEFQPDTYALAAGGKTILDDLGVALNSKQLSPDRIAAIAHVETLGDPALERHVTESMAKAVLTYLVKEGDVGARRLFWSACGASDPLVAEDPGALRNRRMEFLNLEWHGRVAD